MSEDNRWLAIVNPVSGGGRGESDWPVIKRLFEDYGIEAEAVFTERKYHAIELTVEAVNSGFRRIIAVGGDGTLHEIINGVFIQQRVRSTEIIIGVVSLGTGNDWGRTYGFSRDYEKSIRAIAAGHTFLQDVGLVKYFESGYAQQRYIANVAGAGFDSFVIQQYDKLKQEGKRGRLLYMWSLLKGLIRFRSSAMKIRVDGEQVVDEQVFSFSVGIGKYNGGGMMQLPHAISNDGILDLTTIRRIGKLKVIGSLKALYNGKIYEVREVSHHRGRRIYIESHPDTIVEADGEILGNSPFEFEIMAEAIRVIVSEEFLTAK